jgi:hypothetical protein
VHDLDPRTHVATKYLPVTTSCEPFEQRIPCLRFNVAAAGDVLQPASDCISTAGRTTINLQTANNCTLYNPVSAGLNEIAESWHYCSVS